MHICLQLTQVPVRQCIIIVVLVVIDVLPLLALPSFVLQSDGAGLVEARLDVLLAVGNGFILFNVALEVNREKGEFKADTGKKEETRREAGCLHVEQVIYLRGRGAHL